MYLITSGQGKTGRRIAARLRSRDLPVRVGSRSGEPPFDWDRPATWPAALEGVDGAYLAYQPDLSAPAATDAIRAFTAAAVTAGVRSFVVLTGRNDPTAQPALRIVRESGLRHTVLHAAWFAQNFDEDFMADGVAAGELALPVDATPEPFVDVEDLADVAVAALTDPGRHAGEEYEVTGPEALTFAAAVGEIAAAAGRPVRYTPVGLDDLRAGMAAEGVPADLVALYARLFGELFDGRNARPGDGVRRALGREPRAFAAYARDAAARGAWRPAAAPA